MPDDTLDGVNGIIDRLRSCLVDEIPLEDPLTGIRCLNKVRAYHQAHIRRLLTFLDGGRSEFIAGRPLMTDMASRAIYENVANLCDFAQTLKPLCDAVDLTAIDEYVTQAAFTTRIPALLEQHGEKVKAPQILKLIDRMNKQVATYRSSYDHLSDVVHPNGMGAIVYFSTVKGDMMTFGGGALKPNGSIESLFLSAILLAYVELDIADIEQRLQSVSAAVLAGDGKV